VDLYVAYALCVVLALTAVETLVGLVLEIYRPRLKGQAARLLYESRLIGLFGQPGGLITTAAQALDYQFGFKVSETWIFKRLKQAVLLIILLQTRRAVFFQRPLSSSTPTNRDCWNTSAGRGVKARRWNRDSI